jgi:fructokinase
MGRVPGGGEEGALAGRHNVARVSATAKVLVIGEALVDLTVEQDPNDTPLRLLAHPGGSPANVAAGLARLGVPTAFAGRLSATGFGPWLRTHLQNNGVDTAPSVTARENASVALVTLDSAGVPAYTFYVDGTADWQWVASELPDLALVDVAAVHMGSLSVALDPGRTALEEWMRAVHIGGQVFISFDPNVRPTLIDDLPRYRDQMTRLVALAHLVKASEQDLGELYASEDPIEVATRWAASGPATVVVTHGPEGATAVRRPPAKVVYRSAASTDVVDTVGAGDAFTAGLLAWLAERDALTVGRHAALEDEEVEDWLDFANRVAALTCNRPGADPPRRSELSELSG